MKIYLVAFVALVLISNACLDLASGVTFETIASYHLPNKDFYIDIVNVGGGATSADVMQIRRVYQDSTCEVVNNIVNRDSIVGFKLNSDTLTLIVRGRQVAEFLKNDTFRCSINDTWAAGQFKKK